MSKAGGITLKIFLAVFLNDVIDALAQVLMKKGLAGEAMVSWSIHDLLSFVTQNAVSPLVIAGIILCALNFFLWIIVLTKIDLSLAVPLGSTTYALIPLSAVVFLHEKIPLMGIAGIFCVIFGILILSKSKSAAPSMVPTP
ncbi:MAG: EamA family transporter [Candidatus Omnitrophota bacterium]|jgi:drug/metabolite transporter (DMT)-like permease